MFGSGHNGNYHGYARLVVSKWFGPYNYLGLDHFY